MLYFVFLRIIPSSPDSNNLLISHVESWIILGPHPPQTPSSGVSLLKEPLNLASLAALSSECRSTSLSRACCSWKYNVLVQWVSSEQFYNFFSFLSVFNQPLGGDNAAFSGYLGAVFEQPHTSHGQWKRRISKSPTDILSWSQDGPE